MPHFRPRLRFSLRALFVLVTVASLYLGWQWRIVKQRNDMRAAVNDKWNRDAFRISYPLVFTEAEGAEFPWIRRLLSDRPEESVHLLGASEADIERVRALFPEAHISNAIE